jgi:5-methylcytosine-specific restriction endonuclease McrA
MANNSVSNEGGSTRQWRNLRREIIARDKGKCKLCGAGGSVVDHIKPRSGGGSDKKSNLRLICKTCDKRLRARQAAKTAKKQLASEEFIGDLVEKLQSLTKGL